MLDPLVTDPVEAFAAVALVAAGLGDAAARIDVWLRVNWRVGHTLDDDPLPVCKLADDRVAASLRLLLEGCKVFGDLLVSLGLH